MLKDLKAASLEVGFSTIIATSEKNIKDQLNIITRTENLPLALVSWDIEKRIEFDESGFLKNPTTDITMLLVDKAESLEKIELEKTSEEMGDLFIKYIKNLKNYLTQRTNVKQGPITGISFTHVPKFGAGQHSGVMAKFNVQLNLNNECEILEDFEKPVITSSTTGEEITSLGGVNQIVYNITATDNFAVTKFRISGIDSELLTLTGSLVSLNIDPDGNIKDSYTFSVEAEDAAGNVSDVKNVTFSVADTADFEKPIIISSSIGINLSENSGANQLVYTIIATDNIGIFSYQITGTDAALLTITGDAVTLNADPDFETKSSYSFEATATDEAGNVSDVKNVTFQITDIVEVVSILDVYTGASIAYSLRELSSSVTSVVRVRRDSDDAEQDFTAVEITDGTLLTFVGAGSGFVHTMYDQSGNNNNAVQTTALLQPKIVVSGVLFLDNSEPALLFEGAQWFEFTPFAIDKSDGFYCFYVTTWLNSNNDRILSMGKLTSVDYREDGVLVSAREFGLNAENRITLANNSSNLEQLNLYKANSSSNTILKNGVQEGTSINTSTATFTPGRARIGSAVNNNSFVEVNLKELIVFNSNQAIGETEISDDINNYYSIY